MELKIQAWLLDIQQCIEEIFAFAEDCQSFFDYKKDVKTKKAVERNLEIIGEAINRILKEDPSFEIQNAKQIIGTRNRIVHSYDNISDEIIWTIVQRELPKLRSELEQYLKN
jgi:uncharacterized protein with HEPN domain